MAVGQNILQLLLVFLQQVSSRLTQVMAILAHARLSHAFRRTVAWRLKKNHKSSAAPLKITPLGIQLNMSLYSFSCQWFKLTVLVLVLFSSCSRLIGNCSLFVGCSSFNNDSSLPLESSEHSNASNDVSEYTHTACSVTVIPSLTTVVQACLNVTKKEELIIDFSKLSAEQFVDLISAPIKRRCCRILIQTNIDLMEVIQN